MTLPLLAMTLRDLLKKATEEWTKSDDDRPGMEWNCTVESEYGTVCFMANDVGDPEYSHANAALSSSSPCPHEEEAKRLRKVERVAQSAVDQFFSPINYTKPINDKMGALRDALATARSEKIVEALCASCGKYTVKFGGYCPGCGAVI